MRLRTNFWGSTSFKTMLTGHTITPDKDGNYVNHHYLQYHQKVIYPPVITNTIDHLLVLFGRYLDVYHVDCHSILKRCK